jgi:hypothetical protein
MKGPGRRRASHDHFAFNSLPIGGKGARLTASGRNGQARITLPFEVRYSAIRGFRQRQVLEMIPSATDKLEPSFIGWPNMQY